MAELLGNEYYLHLIFENQEIIAKVHADKDATNQQSIKIAFDLINNDENIKSKC